METTVGGRIEAGDVVAVVGKPLAGREARGLADDFVALDDEARAIGVQHDPLAAEQRDSVVRGVVDRDKIDERVRLVRRQARAAVVIAQFVEARGEAGEFAGDAGGHGR